MVIDNGDVFGNLLSAECTCLVLIVMQVRRISMQCRQRNFLGLIAIQLLEHY